jgi:hypothetical protein
MHTITQILDCIDRGLVDDDGQPTGQLFTLTASGPSKERWAGNVIVRLLGCEEQKAKNILKEWVKNEVFETSEYVDPVSRHTRKGVRTNLNNRPDKASE